VDKRSLAHPRHHPRPNTQEDETPHCCYEGWGYLGFEGEDENGEHIEEIERVPCRRCNAASGDGLEPGLRSH
jgi:hypothetical protein